MDTSLENYLHFDPAIEIERCCSFIHSEVNRRGAHGVLLGLSGGVDSSTCAYLCKRCLPPEQIHLLSLPERDSATEPRHSARLVAQELGLPLEEKNLSGLFDELGFYQKVPADLADNRPVLERSIKVLGWLSGKPALYPWAQQYAFDSRHGFLAWLMRRWWWPHGGTTEKFVFGKLRTRMLVLSTTAMERDCLQICTADHSEWSIGFYDPHGDGVGDLAPLCHLYKTQIRTLAQALSIPEEIIHHPSSGDLAAGLPNETVIGLPYEQLDQVLVAFSLGMDDARAAAASGVKRSMVSAVRCACQVAEQRRQLPRVLEPVH